MDIQSFTYFGGTAATFISFLVLKYAAKQRRRQNLGEEGHMSARELKGGWKIVFLALLIASILFTLSLLFALMDEGIALTFLGLLIEAMFIVLLIVNLIFAAVRTSYSPSNKEPLDFETRISKLETASFTIGVMGLCFDIVEKSGFLCPRGYVSNFSPTAWSVALAVAAAGGLAYVLRAFLSSATHSTPPNLLPSGSESVGNQTTQLTAVERD
jgi:hypothetical protein